MFGMGTGGSLRLLSPETFLSVDSIAAAFLLSPLAIKLARVFPYSALQLSFSPHLQNRTGCRRFRTLTKDPSALTRNSDILFFHSGAHIPPGSSLLPSPFALLSLFSSPLTAAGSRLSPQLLSQIKPSTD